MRKLIISLFPVLCLSTPGHADVSQKDAPKLILKPDDADWVENGKLVYAEHCAACHGANLEGAENWEEPDEDGVYPAPPHDDSGHTWHHSEQLLFDLTRYGFAHVMNDPEAVSNMPAYEDILSDQEILNVLSYIKSTWSAKNRRFNDFATVPMESEEFQIGPSPIMKMMNETQ